MRIDEIMTRQLATCTPNDTVHEAALKMKNEDCGLIPVIEHDGGGSPIGVLTDRDITCRVVAGGHSPHEVTVGEVMSRSVVTVHYQARFNSAMRLMERHRLRRLVVTGDSGDLMGVLSLTDLARYIGRDKLGQVLQEVSSRRPPRSQE